MEANPQLSVRLYVWFATMAAVFALTETFSRIETAIFAAYAWGGLLIALGLGHTVLLLIARRPRGWGMWWFGHALTGLVVGGLTVALAGWEQVLLTTWSITVWSLISGVTTLVHATRQRVGTERTDWFVVGGATSLLGLVTLVVPADLVATMGFAGVWGSIVAVFLGIGAVNLHLANRPQKGH